MNEEERVEEALKRLPSDGEVRVEFRPCDVEEDLVVEEFMRRGCGCKKREGGSCSATFTVDYVKSMRLSCR